VRLIRSKEGEELAVAEAQLFRFPAGLPGFENEREFALLEAAETAPVVTLQSTTNSNLAFLAVPVGCLDSSYEAEILQEDLATLGIEEASEAPLEWLALIALDRANVTANLMAPVVLNRTSGLGVQAVRCDQRYSPAYPFGQITNQAGSESQSTANGSPSCS
jgi:flagellar assembly factor FliW